MRTVGGKGELRLAAHSRYFRISGNPKGKKSSRDESFKFISR